MSGLPARIEGSWTALVTPFQGGRVDHATLARLVERQIAAGTAGLCPCGTTGESPTISYAEHRAIIDTVVATARGRVPVVAGAGSNDTHHAVDLVKSAKAAGAVGALAVAPYYNRPTQEGLYRHFRAMADEGGLPLMLYHIPGRTGVHVDVETIARLRTSGGMLALKEAHGTVDRVTRLRELTDLPILSGDDGLTLPMMALGATGVVSVASNVVPAEVATMVAHALAGRGREALALHEKMAPLVRALFLETNPIPVKSALLLTKHLPCADLRLPLVPASPSVVAALTAALERCPPAM